MGTNFVQATVKTARRQDPGGGAFLSQKPATRPILRGFSGTNGTFLPLEVAVNRSDCHIVLSLNRGGNGCPILP
jgi:hypothetical protein